MIRLVRSSGAHSCIFALAASWEKENSGRIVSIWWIHVAMRSSPIGSARSAESSRPGRFETDGGLHHDLVIDPDEPEKSLRRDQSVVLQGDGILHVEGN